MMDAERDRCVCFLALVVFYLMFPKKVRRAVYWLIPADAALKFNTAVSLRRYQIVVEIIHATTISSLPQLKKQKGTTPV